MTKLEPTDLIAVEVPDNGQSHKTIYNSEMNTTCVRSNWFYEIEPETITVLNGPFEIIGEATKDRCCLYKGKTINPLLQSNGLYFVNPVEKPEKQEYRSMVYSIKIQDWLLAESKVIKGKLIILKPKS